MSLALTSLSLKLSLKFTSCSPCSDPDLGDGSSEPDRLHIVGADDPGLGSDVWGWLWVLWWLAVWPLLLLLPTLRVQVRNDVKQYVWWSMHAVYYSNITWPSWRLKSLTTWLFVQQCVYHQKKWNLHITDPFVKGIHRWPVDSLHKGPIMWKVLILPIAS